MAKSLHISGFGRERRRWAKVKPASLQREPNTWDTGPVGDPDPAGSPVEDALTIIQHLRGYLLPAERMPAARAIAAHLRPLLASADLDLADTVRRLIEVEDELARLGGRFDPELAAADAVGVERVVVVAHHLAQQLRDGVVATLELCTHLFTSILTLPRRFPAPALSFWSAEPSTASALEFPTSRAPPRGVDRQTCRACRR